MFNKVWRFTVKIMDNIPKYKNKKILILGLAQSGLSSARVLYNSGALVTVNDWKTLEESPEAQELLKHGIRVITGSHPIELMEEDFTLIVKNPGIPYSNLIIEKAVEKKIPIITEVELAYELAQIRGASIVGITGTNGKTTTTTMIAELLNTNRSKGAAYLSGNIGSPASSVASKASYNDDLIMELSSFQLLGIKNFRPSVAVITNLHSAHLDYHGLREEYVRAKWRIQKNLTKQNYLVINIDQVELLELSKKTEATVVPFSRREKVSGAYCLDGNLYYKNEKIMAANDLEVIGSHNVENALAAIAVAKLRGVANENIRQVLHDFHGVAHRLQFVKKINKRKFYNDSKATNILATKKALSGFDNKKTILLAGGLDRGDNFAELVSDLTNLKALIVFGQVAPKLLEVGRLAKIKIVKSVKDVKEAVLQAYEVSEAGDNILLSPANASWDQYKNFEVRGEKFMEAIEQLV